MYRTKHQEDFQREKGKSHLLVGHTGQDYNSFAFVSWLIQKDEDGKVSLAKKDKEVKKLETEVKKLKSEIAENKELLS